MGSIILDYLIHRGNEWISVACENKESINTILRRHDARWTKTHRCWLIHCSKDNLRNLLAALEGKASVNWDLLKIALEKRRNTQPSKKKEAKIKAQEQVHSIIHPLSEANRESLRRMLETLHLKAYSSKTIQTYRNEFLQLLSLLGKRAVDSLSTDDIRRYLNHCIKNKGLKENTIHSRINAIKFYYEQVLHREQLMLDVPRPKKPLQLPRFFNQSEIAAIIKAADNLKQRVMLMLAYSAGLRVSEVVAIRTRNIDSKRMCILIEGAKGKKDRIVSLSPVLLVMLREYWNTYKPTAKGYLFQGQNEEMPYSSRSLQNVLEQAKKKAGILKPGSIHALRHSFATHLLDKGTDVTMIMKLLGHNDLKTTLRYLHVTNRDMLQVFSPLDDLNLDPKTNLRNPKKPKQ